MIMLSSVVRSTFNVSRRFMQTLTSTLDPIQDKAMNELCILTNENDEATGYASKRDCHLVKRGSDILLHRAFSLLLFNSNNELLLQKRSSTKITYPGYVSNTCCSHPLYDIDCERETENALGVKIAAQRRLHFELGVPPGEADVNSMHYLTRIHYKSLGDGVWGEHEIDYILIMHKDVTINPNPDEVSDIHFVSKKQLKNYLYGSSSPVSPWFKYLVESDLLEHWWNNLHQLDKISDVDKIYRASTV